MDSLHGSGFGSAYDTEDDDDDMAVQAPPPAVGQDERRMQVRAYNFWASLLGTRQFPSADSLLAGRLPDFAANAVLLHFDNGIEDPAIALVGEALAAECDAGTAMHRLSDVPGRSLLSRITDHYLQIIANRAPIGFEAEFVNQRGRTILYRGILLPFSTDDDAIDYIYGVINWKELADQQTTDALLLEVGAALAAPASFRRSAALTDGDCDAADEAPLPAMRSPDALNDWADGPAPLDLAQFGAPILQFPQVDPREAAVTLPGPRFGAAADRPANDDQANDDQAATVAPAAEPASLADWLASARDLAAAARSSEDRTRGALYAAISRAWDFAIAAGAAPDDYARMVADAGFAVQERAPLTALVKLVFGADYDKTRLTEFATALSHARRLDLPAGGLAPLLAGTPGGLKGIIAAERRLRRAEAGEAQPRPAPALDERLRRMPHRPLTALAREGAEFALVLVRRMPGEEPALLGEVDADDALIARAARHLAG